MGYSVFAAVAAVAASAALSAASDMQSCLTQAVGGDSSLVAFPGDLFYQASDVHPYNLDIPVTPAAVTYPKSAEHVASIVGCASDYSHKVQARSGGHSYGNYCLGGANSSAVVIDMKNFQQFEMDRTTWIATVGPGTLLGDNLERMHNAGGRIIAQGIAPQVGIGGHATIGGLGALSRQLGAALDQVVEVEVVLANSSIVRASKAQNPDLFFAIRGAGASFGVVTEFKFQTSPEPGEMVQYIYNITIGSDLLAETFKAWTQLVSKPDLSRKFSSTLIIFDGGMVISGMFFGSKPEFDTLNLVGQLPHIGNVNVTLLSSLVSLGDAVTNAGLELAGGIPSNFYSKSLTFTPTTLMNNKSIDALFSYLNTAKTDSLLWFIVCDLEGGAINDIPLSDAAYSLRDVTYFLQSYAIDIGKVDQTTRDFLTEINQIFIDNVPGVRGAYPGYVDPALPNAREEYWGSNLPRLEQIKAEIDPTDIFHNPQSVQPATS